MSKSFKVASDSHARINGVNTQKLLHQLFYVAVVVPVAMVVVAVVSTMCRGNVQDLLLLIQKLLHKPSYVTVVVPVAMVVVALVSTMCKGNVQDLLLLLPFF
jgi:hypothetical protein